MEAPDLATIKDFFRFYIATSYGRIQLRLCQTHQNVLALPHSENELIPWSQGLRPSQQLLLNLLPHELQTPSKKTHTSSLHLLRQLDLRQAVGLDERECKQSARRPRGGQGGYQRNRQESDDLNTKGSIQISYLVRQNDDGEVVVTIS